MEFVIDGLLAVAILFGTLWWISLRISTERDRKEAQQREREAQEEKHKVDQQTELTKPGVKLRCLNCETQFIGPLTADGCPHCHLISLVVTETEHNYEGRNEI